MWICISLRCKSAHRQLLQFCYYVFENLRQKSQHKGSFFEFRRSSDWFFAERIMERSWASRSCGSRTAAPLLNGAEQPWEFSALIRSLNRSDPLLTAPILDPPHLWTQGCIFPENVIFVTFKLPYIENHSRLGQNFCKSEFLSSRRVLGIKVSKIEAITVNCNLAHDPKNLHGSGQSENAYKIENKVSCPSCNGIANMKYLMVV